MRPAAPTCKAINRGCGTATGWRNGGRCPRCRGAHNDDTARQRRLRKAPPAATIDALVERLLAGEDLPSAARNLDIHPSTARSLAKDHEHVAAALRGFVEGQAYRQAEYLRLLVEGASVIVAREQLSLASRTVHLWRDDAIFKAAEDAIRAFIAGAAVQRNRTRRRGRVQTDKAESYLQLRAAGRSNVEASQELGLSISWASGYRRNHPEFDTRLREVDPGRPGRRPRLLDDDLLRTLWADQSLTMQEVYDRLGASRPTVIGRAATLGLPRPRPRQEHPIIPQTARTDLQDTP